MLAATINDGANEANGHADATGYVMQNDPTLVALVGTTMRNPSRWQPLALKYSVTQSGIPLPSGPQTFVGVNARNTRTFALVKPTPTMFALDPGPPPQFNTATHAAFVQEAVDVIEMSSMLDPTDGATPQPTLLRSVGPELENFGSARDLCERDPRLELHRASDDVVLLTNDNWGTSPRATQIVAQSATVSAFPLTAVGADAAVLISLPEGGYTVVTRSSAPAARGIALAEVYGEHLVNLSTRRRVVGGDNALIAGFVVEESESMPVLVRAVGPSLSTFGVTGTLVDPVLTVYRHEANGQRTVVATNNNGSDDDAASLAAYPMVKTFAFPLAPGSKNAVLFLPLPAGVYSAVVGSADNTEGVALAEVYHVK